MNVYRNACGLKQNINSREFSFLITHFKVPNANEREFFYEKLDEIDPDDPAMLVLEIESERKNTEIWQNRDDEIETARQSTHNRQLEQAEAMKERSVKRFKPAEIGDSVQSPS